MPERNPSPKSQFIASKANVNLHAEIFSRADVQGILTIALAQYQRSTSEKASTSDETAAALHYKAKGAQEYLSTLMNLCETPSLASVMASDNLNHKT